MRARVFGLVTLPQQRLWSSPFLDAVGDGGSSPVGGRRCRVGRNLSGASRAHRYRATPVVRRGSEVRFLPSLEYLIVRLGDSGAVSDPPTVHAVVHRLWSG